MERHTQVAGPVASSFRLISAGLISILIACSAVIDAGANQDQKPPQPTKEKAVRASLHNVKYRFAENVSVQINDLRGAILPLGDRQTPVFDDKESFKVRINAAEVAISPQD